MSRSIELLVLGPIEIERAGTRAPVTSRLQRRLLTALVVARGRTVSVDALAEALWDDRPPPSARNTLQSHVARLRDLLGDPLALLTRSPGYAFDLDRIATDVDRFTAEVYTARQAATGPAEAVTLLETALTRWRGEPFGDDGGPLATAEVERLRELHLHARRALAGARQAAGDVSAALELRTALHEADPLREDDATALAEVLARVGRVPEALEVLRRHRRALVDELGLDPRPAVTALERRLLAANDAATTEERPAPHATDTLAPRPVAPVALRPPRVPTTFGREQDVTRLAAALTSADVVTIVGPGGVGKTHLAALVAARGRSAWFDLTRLRQPEHLHAALADALVARPGPDRTTEDVVVDALRRFRGTVVLDNCEHLLDAVAELVSRVVRDGAAAPILATSRERLDVRGEQVVRLGPLPVPDPERASADEPAVALFQRRLSEAGGRPVTTADAAAVVAAVDGLPLALELAAAQAVTLPVTAMLDQLGQHLGLLVRSRPRRHDRHARIADVIDWSHDLLDDDDRTLYRRLAVFAATFRLADVQAVCGAPPLDAGTAATALGRLVERSMVVRVGDDRYRLLEPLRLDAVARLDASADRPVVEERQRRAVVELAERARTVVNRAPAEVELLLELPHTLADVRAVRARSIAAGDRETERACTARRTSAPASRCCAGRSRCWPSPGTRSLRGPVST